ncbi:family 2 glycosyl transferase [Paenibacillus sp. F411]|uniref:family 2 glycosyl transferase n=1 Tax=Paenibacillus sp. F411 TaxID=2820239 RepID=UPI001AAF5115|nr:family 2 glycosyl transferase [Paenibacillus sp. F411]MBO2944589.1 family 2 glycosyl transferase [Paenibacillus sp. F411]
MKSKARYILLILSIFLAGLVTAVVLIPERNSDVTTDDRPEKIRFPYVSKVENGSFHVRTNTGWEPFFVKGVNIGAGKPGAFPGELAITYEEYLRWFQYISDMNANTIRVYTTLRPQFYNALLDFNQSNEAAGKDPLYLIHGVWVDENDILTIEDAFGEEDKIVNDVIRSGKEIVDILHGDRYLAPNKGHADGTYTSDVSSYVIGWILGIEWEPAFVVGTDENNTARDQFEGKHLFTENASPFEIFLAEMGDGIMAYEQEKYGMQRPVAFSNWVTTDPLTHSSEPYPNEDLVEVNVEHIKTKESYETGMFASYHVYPYYPDTFSFQKEYIEYMDERGQANPYRAYLEDLKQVHSIPIVISEFGIPASRGKAHENRVTGFNQGFIDEKTQGDMIMHMMTDIHDAGLAGGIVFAWQDEWFKRTWNNNDLDLPDSRPFWSNTQTNEQHFGLLAFDPGSPGNLVEVDGNAMEWQGEKPFYEDERLKLYVRSDEAYMYFRVEAENYNFEQDTLLLPMDTISGQGNDGMKDMKVSFSEAADFVLQIQGPDNSRLLVDAYYDNYYFRYAVLTDLLERQAEYHTKNSGLFNPIFLALNKQIKIPTSGEVIPFTGYETGKLLYGISNPEHPEYNSLSDFYYQDGQLEIRIPWQLLNVMDPSRKMIMDDMHARGTIASLKTDSFHIGIMQPDENAPSNVPMSRYTWEDWERPSYHERLKPSYYILQEGFKGLSTVKE